MEVLYMKKYYKPNMTGLKGKTGRKIIEEIKTHTVLSDDNIRKEASECKKRLMTEYDRK